jgi:deazaflavin-dependent oxidoreductase (nitroreductase family)
LEPIKLFEKLTLFFLKRKNLVKLMTRFHILLYRLTGGWVGGLVSGVPNLLLTTTGRKSGLKRTTPLFFLPDRGNFVVVASYGGNPKAPLWWKNLQADPVGWVEVGDRTFEVRASQASEELKDILWPVFVRHYPQYEHYQERTDRVIPLVVLEPVQ